MDYKNCNKRLKGVVINSQRLIYSKLFKYPQIAQKISNILLQGSINYNAFLTALIDNKY